MILEQTIANTRAHLLSLQNERGHWEGELSSSALSTATAVVALSLVDAEQHAALIERGARWLAEHQNDGGWGDTTISKSNLSTTLLCWSALTLVDKIRACRCPDDVASHTSTPLSLAAVFARCEPWIRDRVGSLDADAICKAVVARYGKDKTFSVPILMTCALAGRLGAHDEAWRRVLALPFELAALPRAWFGAVGLPVVSYALPALIAIGHARFHHAPPSVLNPLRWLRAALWPRIRPMLKALQPSTGGYLEATPLTSFVTMALAGSGEKNHPCVPAAVEFLRSSQRGDGSWPIDTNLATWGTTLAAKALAGSCWSPVISRSGGRGEMPISHWSGGAVTAETTLTPALSRRERARVRGERPDGSPTHDNEDAPHLLKPGLQHKLQEQGAPRIAQWLLDQQYKTIHPFTNAAPGGWAWTDLPGGVPDADDTAGALIALWHLSRSDDARRKILPAIEAGVTWLIDLQNRDGGVPTFCRGWGALPFDRSTPELTAHAMWAIHLWSPLMDRKLSTRWTAGPSDRAQAYLAKKQHDEGWWEPLWFGNEHTADESNRVYGTAQVLAALLHAGMDGRGDFFLRPVSWLITQQHADGSWGGVDAAHASIEETALVLNALAVYQAATGSSDVTESLRRAAAWLIIATKSGTHFPPAPIGLYFARLWYHEQLYPVIWTLQALEALETFGPHEI